MMKAVQAVVVDVFCLSRALQRLVVAERDDEFRRDADQALEEVVRRRLLDRVVPETRDGRLDLLLDLVVAANDVVGYLQRVLRLPELPNIRVRRELATKEGS